MRSRLWSKRALSDTGVLGVCMACLLSQMKEQHLGLFQLSCLWKLLASFEHDPLTPLLPLIQLNGTGGVAMALCLSCHISLPIALTAILRWDDTLQEEALISSPFSRMVVPACLKR